MHMTSYTTTDNTIPEGMYLASFEGVEPISGQWGERLCWRFKLADADVNGDYAGATAAAFSGSVNATIRSNLCKFLCSLKGVPSQAGLECDPDDFVNQQYRITVGETDSGSTKIVSFKPAADSVADLVF